MLRANEINFCHCRQCLSVEGQIKAAAIAGLGRVNIRAIKWNKLVTIKNILKCETEYFFNMAYPSMINGWYMSFLIV